MPTRSSVSTPPPPAGRFDSVPQERVLFGAGAMASLANECARLEVGRLFVVASPSLDRQIDVRTTAARATGGRVAGVFTGGRPHVPDEVVLAAAAAAREAGADGILSVGGGSAVDLGKAVQLCLAEGVRTREDLLSWRVVFEYPDKIKMPAASAPHLPHFAVGTTLSASEFTGIIGITDTVRKVKDLYITPSLAPRMVVLDSELARHTPRELWASTGIRAIDHAVEGLCSTDAQPITDALCADALRRLARYLPVSVRDASDLHAAGHCQVAAWESIFGLMNVSLGLSHGIGHQLGARCDVPHGVTSCVMLPTVLEFNLTHTEARQREIAEIFAREMGESAEVGAAELIRRFVRSLGLPTRLRDVGVSRDSFPDLARDAMADLIVATNPRPVSGADEVIEILNNAY
ncbi:maleylacetate reductase [Amycolatopsis sp. AA4]|uniref:iron-containing alcohol dehydrogenase n=1 Tax=Actinomycetes TaxID=1760 RepID=UPI0001DEE2A1|nr:MULTISPECIES: iron-containing alcohol dehydrogenase [Actinomycetes]ATY11261.1 maleylacetate reductase [Amycolatopsis sp. AA4]EFL06851.1 lactaldehyde reductase [Streptomyces sp. AA4]